MAGPSGAGMVASYLRSMRGGSRRTDARTALRRELGKHGRDPDYVDFDCYALCMECGHLVEPPKQGSPMRRDTTPGPDMRECPACGTRGLADLRHTPTAYSLSALESDEPKFPAMRVLGFVTSLAALVLLGGPVFLDILDDPGAVDQWFRGSLLLGMLVLLVIGFLPSPRIELDDEGAGEGRPRRWRLPRAGQVLGSLPWRTRPVSGRVRSETGDLLRAPLSGRPCVAYEVAVRSDDDPSASMSSWTLLEQDNVEFHVGEVEVERGDALLTLPRSLAWRGVLAKQGERVKRFMRMRGLLDVEEVYVYETIVAPGDSCSVVAGDDSGPARICA